MVTRAACRFVGGCSSRAQRGWVGVGFLRALAASRCVVRPALCAINISLDAVVHVCALQLMELALCIWRGRVLELNSVNLVEVLPPLGLHFLHAGGRPVLKESMKAF